MTATEELWRAFRTPLHAFVQKRVQHAQDAEDILAEVFLKLHERTGELPDVDDVRAWLYQITRHAIIDYHRSHRTLPLFDEELVLPQEPSEDVTMELASCVERLLDSLPENDQRALQAVATGQSQGDLAQEEGLSPTGARSRVQRARSRLMDAFHTCCRLEFDGVGRVVDWQRHDPCDDSNGRC